MKIRMTNPRFGSLRVNTKLWIPEQNKYVKMRSIFDTGASKTIISSDAAKLLGITVNKPSGLQTITAADVVNLESSILPKISIGAYEINDVPVLIANLPPELESHCVLGMNVLREFLITIDSIDRTITLKHRPYPKRYHLENYSVSMLADTASEGSQIATTNNEKQDERALHE